MAQNSTNTTDFHGSAGHVAAAAVFVGLLFLIAIAPPIFAGYDHGRAVFDQDVFHLPAIRAFSQEWPHFDFSDYSAATTPGFHLVIAAAKRFIRDDLRVMRFVGAIFSIGLFVTLAAAVARRQRIGMTGLLCLPLACSLYVYSSAVCLLPENAAWWGVVGVLLIALRPNVDRWTYLLGGMVTLLLVLVRQNDLWVAAPLCLACWIGSDRKESALLQLLLKPTAPRFHRLALMFLALIPALGAVGWFVSIWHGMVPPSQRPMVGATNAAGPASALATAGGLGLFFLPFFLSSVPRRQLPAILALGAVLGLFVGAAPVSTYSVEAGRYSGLWNAVRWAPYVWHRSPVIIGLSMLGGMVVAVWLAALPRRERWVWAGVVVAFGATQAATHGAYQRYYEPLVLIAAAISLPRLADKTVRWAWIGPVLLSAILAAVTVITLR